MATPDPADRPEVAPLFPVRVGMRPAPPAGYWGPGTTVARRRSGGTTAGGVRRGGSSAKSAAVAAATASTARSIAGDAIWPGVLTEATLRTY